MKQTITNGNARRVIALLISLIGYFTASFSYAQPTASMATSTNGDHYTITVTYPPGAPCGHYLAEVELCPDSSVSCFSAVVGSGVDHDAPMPAPTVVFQINTNDAVGHHLYIHGQTGDNCIDRLLTFGQTQKIGDCTYGGPGNNPSLTGNDNTQGPNWNPAIQNRDSNQTTGSSDPVNLGTGTTYFEESDFQPVRQPGETLSAVLAFGRYQSSGNPILSPFQGGWSHNYNVSIVDLSTSVLITDWQGSLRSFTFTNGLYEGDGTSALIKTNGDFLWELPHGTQYLFDSTRTNRLNKIIDRVNSSVSLAYNASNLITGIVDNAGRQLSLSYNTSNQLINVVDPFGRTNSFTCDVQGRLTTVSDALGTKSQYIYGDDSVTNGITQFVNARGSTNSFIYNALLQAIAETNMLGKVQTYDWVNTNQQVTVTKFDGTTYTNYNDASGAVTARVDAAGTQQYWRDGLHRATNIVDRLGHSTQYLFDTNISANGFSGNLLRQIDSLGRTNGWSYEATFNFPLTFTNAAGGVTSWAYDSKGNVTNTTDAVGNVTLLGYDGSGNQNSITDANLHVTMFGYDQYGNRTNITDALNHPTGFTYDIIGRRIGQTDALGRSESSAWDDRDRLTQQVDAAGETNTWNYDGNGNQVAWTDSLGHTRTNSYDALDRLTATTLPGDPSPFVTYGYDDADNRTNVTDALGHATKFGYDALGRLTGTTNALNKAWTYIVDAEGRRVKTIDPNSHSQGSVYDAVGQLTALTNALTQVTAFNYDSLGNLTNVTDARTNPLGFNYDAISRLTAVTYAGGSTEQFFHDRVGNVTGLVIRAGETIATTYDAANRLTQKSYVGTSDAFTYGYDDANQLTGLVAAVSGGSVTSKVGFAYDAAGRLTNETQTVGTAPPRAVGYEYYADGRRSRLNYPDGTNFITYVYNAKGWLTDILDGGTNAIVTYSYDVAGRRTLRSLENHTFTTYVYDDANQLTDIWHQVTSGGATNMISRYEYGYDDAGNRKWVKRAHQSNKGDVYTYDAADQLTDVKYNAASPDSSPSGWDREVTYGYDPTGNRTNLIEKIGSATNTTSYIANSDNQLTSSAVTRQGLTVTGLLDPGPKSNKWYNSAATARGVIGSVSSVNGTFSLPGVPVSGGANALTVTATDVSGNIATQVVNVTIATGTTTLRYDGNGNQTNDATWAYTYDRENRLKSASNGTLVINYSYDGTGRLIERRTSGNSATTNRLYYAGGQLVAEYDGAGVLQRRYVNGPGIDEPLRMTSIGGMSSNYYYHVDGLGSVAEVTDSGGAKIETYTYDVYGTPTMYNASGAIIGTSQIANRLLFTGRDRDTDTGWYNYRNRYHNPSLGRFVQPDPLRMGGGLNLYRYCGNRPTSLLDPTGLCSKNKDNPWGWGDAINYTIQQWENALQNILSPVSKGANWVQDNIFDPIGFGPGEQATLAATPGLWDPALAAWDDLLNLKTTATAAEDILPAAENVLPVNESQLGHIFRDAEGHLPNTAENQQLLRDVANDSASTLGTDQFGNTWAAKTLPDGTQAWVQTRNGQIINGGLNQTPRVFNPQTGLSSPTKPSN